MKKNRAIPEPLRTIDQDGIGRAALVLGMVEAISRPEPAQAAPAIAAMLRGRRPSEIPQRITEALIDGLFIAAEVFARKSDILEALTRNGSTPEDAEEFFLGQLYSRKWAAIARAAGK